MAAANNIGTAQPQQYEPSLARSSTRGSTRPRSTFSSHSSQVWPDGIPSLQEPVDGWPTVAKMMTTKPEFGNLCRFSDLNMKSLLYYQAELFQLRKELHEHEYTDYRTGEQEGIGPGTFFWRADCLIASKDDANHEQWDVIVKIRKVLKEYSKFSRIIGYVIAK